MGGQIKPIWLREDVVYAIHRRQLAEHGGAEGVRDPNLLLSALARPRNLLAYSEQETDLCSLAASYAFGIARNHPFIDGNKRTALVVCRTFLKVNRYDFTASQEEKYHTFLELAAGDLSEEDLAAWLRARLHPLV